jgi:hypothetical protein
MKMAVQLIPAGLSKQAKLFNPDQFQSSNNCVLQIIPSCDRCHRKWGGWRDAILLGRYRHNAFEDRVAQIVADSTKKQSNGSSQVNNDDISCPLTFQSF